MRKIKSELITQAIEDMVIDAAITLRPDVLAAFKAGLEVERKKQAKETLRILIENAERAEKNALPLCQDTGVTIVYCEVGQDVCIQGDLNKAINQGVKNATKKAHLRHSIVADPIVRYNTKTNTPAFIHHEIVKGDGLKLSVILKGFGSENKGNVSMLNPTSDMADIEHEILRVIKSAGPNACPPFVIGVGVGGTLDAAADAAKKIVCEPIGKRSRVPWAKKMEERIIKKANSTGIGPLGLGGRMTVLDIKIAVLPTHIAGLPVAVNVNCHAVRTRTKKI